MELKTVIHSCISNICVIEGGLTTFLKVYTNLNIGEQSSDLANKNDLEIVESGCGNTTNNTDAKKWPFVVNGGPSSTKSQLLFSSPQLINIIEFSSLPTYLNQIVLHQKYITEGLSTTKIARELGISRTTVTVYLKKYNIPLRPVGKVKSKRTLAYGEKIINGKVEDHKQEKRTIDSILKMKKEGLSYNAIARILNEMKVKTKSQGKKWHMETVRQIILREQV